MSTKTLMTAEGFARMDTAENESYELVDGEPVRLSSAIPLHGLIRDRLVQSVRNYFDRNPIGGTASETDCRINSDTVRKPDLSVFLGERWQQLDLYRVPVLFAPDIAVEVLSPSEHAMDVTRKVRDYLSAGSQQVWLLDHDSGELHIRTKAGIRLLEGNTALTSPLLPSFSVSVADLLASR